MHHRKLAALLATTTVAATPTLVATRAAGADEAPHPVLHLDTGLDNMPAAACTLLPPMEVFPVSDQPALIAQAGAYKGEYCPDGSVSLLYSADRVHWKSMATAPVLEGSGGAGAIPWHGDFWYQSYYITADGTGWGSTDSTSPVHIVW